MNHYFVMLKENTSSLKNAKVLAGISLFIALTVVLNSFTIQLSPLLRISFGNLAVAASCYFFGPIPNMLAGPIIDFFGYILRPVGPYQPWFMINAILMAFIYASFFYKKDKVKITHCIFARFLVVVICNMCLNSLWLSMLYGDTFWSLFEARIVKNIALFPIDVFLLYTVMKISQRMKSKVI